MKRIGFAATLAVVLSLTSAGSAEWKSLVGRDAANFKVSQWFNPSEGSTVSDFRGKAILLEFWATW